MNYRLCFLIGQLDIGGYEKQLFTLVSNLDKRRFKSLVIVWGEGKGFYFEQLTNKGFQVISLGRVSSLQKIIQIRRILQQNQIDILHCYSFYLNFISWLCSVAVNVKAIGSVRSNIKYESQKLSIIMKVLNLIFPKRHIFNNHAALRWLQQRSLVVFNKKNYVVHNGIEYNRYQFVGNRLGSSLKILNIGSLTDIKRTQWMIKLGQKLQEEGIEFTIDILGDGPRYDALKQEIENKEMENKIFLHGKQPDPSSFFSKAVILVNTSLIEGFPNTVLEAMASGLPVVTTDVGDVSEMIQSGQEGFIAPVNDFGMLCKQVILLSKQPDLRKKFSTNARNKVIKNFSVSALLKNTTAVYEDSVGQ